jgi:hypothetical protein
LFPSNGLTTDKFLDIGFARKRIMGMRICWVIDGAQERESGLVFWNGKEEINVFTGHRLPGWLRRRLAQESGFDSLGEIRTFRKVSRVTLSEVGEREDNVFNIFSAHSLFCLLFESLDDVLDPVVLEAPVDGPPQVPS